MVSGGVIQSLDGYGGAPHAGPYYLNVVSSGNGPVSCQVLADAAFDSIGNGNLASNTASVNFDANGPFTLRSPYEMTESGFGRGAAGVPDIDGDGLGEILIGAYREQPPERPLPARHGLSL